MKNTFVVLVLICVVGIQGCNNSDEAPNISLEKYFENNNISGATKSSTGLYYVIDEEGTGNLPSFGDSITLHYNGYFTDGSVFDASKEGYPVSIVYLENVLIKGMEEGLGLFKKGGSGTIYKNS